MAFFSQMLAVVALCGVVSYGQVQNQACTDNQLLAHPSSCAMFIACNGGVGFDMQCPIGTLFNSQTSRCDFYKNVNCNTGNQVNMCEPNPCPASMYCEQAPNDMLGYKCRRVTIVNACSLNPSCPIGTVCVNTQNVPEGYVCRVNSNGGGGVVVNACSNNPCGNRGSCNVNSFGGYVCNCFNGFTGTNCESRLG